MKIRQKVFIGFALPILVLVAGTCWMVDIRVRQVFDRLDLERAQAIESQFQRDLDRQAIDTAAAVKALASGEDLHNLALNLAGGDSPEHYFTVASPLARDYHLDYLGIVAADGRILSSAQYPALFGRKEAMLTAAGKPPYLRQEDLPSGMSQLGVFAVRAVPRVARPLYVVGGTQLGADLLHNLTAPPGTGTYLYRNLSPDFDLRNFLSSNAAVAAAEQYRPLIEEARSSGSETHGVVDWNDARQGASDVTAFPLKGTDHSVLAVLIVASSRRGRLEIERDIREVGLGASGLGLIFAFGASLLVGGWMTRPLDELSSAASRVAGGAWDTRINLVTRGEAGACARAFNTMTARLIEQRERLVQGEKAKAWRELAEHVAKELKNPLASLQEVVEAWLRGQQAGRSRGVEVSAENVTSLRAQVGHLSTLVSQLDEFSSVSSPQLELLDLRDAVRRVLKFHEPALEIKGIEVGTSISAEPLPIAGDPELLHRALSTLMMNGIDSQPVTGRLAVAVTRRGDGARISIEQKKKVVAEEAINRLLAARSKNFTQGGGFNLAMVQLIVSSHNGTFLVEDAEGEGVRYLLVLPIANRGREGPGSSFCS